MRWDDSIEQATSTLNAAGLRRAAIIGDPDGGGVPTATHSQLNDICKTIASDPNFDNHAACFFEIGERSGQLLSAFIHRTERGQAAGGIRHWSYERIGDLITDGLRLSRAMGQKCALAGLWWGGGKGVIAATATSRDGARSTRDELYRDYGRFLSGLRGCYVGAEDVGTTPADMAAVFRETRHTTCIPPEVGGSGNPSEPTARGVVVAMEAALHYLGLGTLSGKRIAMQGLGNVSRFMMAELLARGVKQIIGCDIDEATVSDTTMKFRRSPVECRLVNDRDDSIFAEPCDIFVPNAIGGTLNPATIDLLQTRIVCGAANNQLEESRRDADHLRQRGILYVPDFVANRMGIVTCANEQYGWFEGDPAIEGHLDQNTPWGVYQRCQQIFEASKRASLTTAEAAERIADKLTQDQHPIWGNRAGRIISYLIERGWAEGSI